MKQFFVDGLISVLCVPLYLVFKLDCWLNND